MDQQRAQEIFEKVEKLTSADEVELLISGGRHSLTRFANNGIHQNVSDEGVTISIRTVMDGRTARATTSRIDDESIARSVKAAERFTQVQVRDPGLLPMAEKQTAKAGPSRHFAQTAALTPEDRAAMVSKIVGVAKKNELVTAGIYATQDTYEGAFNSNGLVAFHQQTLAEISITMLADKLGSSGWQKQNSPDAAKVDGAQLASIAAEKARGSARPREIPPGAYTVILEPSAVLDLVGFMFWDFGGQSVLDERSFLNKRLGTKLFGENITIRDDAYHPLQSGPAFDGEGVPREPVILVEKGTVANLVYSRGSAAKMAKSALAAHLPSPPRATGHGFPLPNEMGDAPMNIVFENHGKPTSVPEMIASTERGVLVTRLWYIREVEPYEKMLTGMTRDGTFLVENGKVSHGVLNFRFNQGLVQLLNNVMAMGEPVRASGEEAFDMVVPAMKVSGFNFTEVTKF